MQLRQVVNQVPKIGSTNNTHLLLEVVVVSLVENQFLLLQVDDLLAHTVEELLVVRYDEQSLFPPLQVVVQPNHSIQICCVKGMKNKG